MTNELDLISCRVVFDKGVISIKLNNGDILILDKPDGIKLSKYLNANYAQHCRVDIKGT